MFCRYPIDNQVRKIMRTYHEALDNVDIKVNNAIFDSMNSIAATEFSSGWIAASIWMAERYGYKENEWVKDNLDAKKKEIEKLFGIKEKDDEVLE